MESTALVFSNGGGDDPGCGSLAGAGLGCGLAPSPGYINDGEAENRPLPRILDGVVEDDYGGGWGAGDAPGKGLPCGLNPGEGYGEGMGHPDGSGHGAGLQKYIEGEWREAR